jgi:hypothetical protein
MIRNISLKVWDNKDYLINDKRILVVGDDFKDNEIRISFDEELFHALQADTTYELKVDNISVSIHKVYKSGRRLVIEYIGGC